jgi:hypothetical protein
MTRPSARKTTEQARNVDADEVLTFQFHKMLSESSVSRVDSLSAWLLATLVAVNTSGAGATLLAANKAASMNKLAAAAFATGICMAILSGMISRMEASKRVSHHSDANMKWIWDDAEERTRYDSVGRQIIFLSRVGFALNLVSLSAFAVGCVLISIG